MLNAINTGSKTFECNSYKKTQTSKILLSFEVKMPQWKATSVFTKQNLVTGGCKYLIPVTAFPELFPMCSAAFKIIATGTVTSRPQHYSACHKLWNVWKEQKTWTNQILSLPVHSYSACSFKRLPSSAPKIKILCKYSNSRRQKITCYENLKHCSLSKKRSYHVYDLSQIVTSIHNLLKAYDMRELHYITFISN